MTHSNAQQQQAKLTPEILTQVWNFIIEREVEAPERFQAIQSYRATMAVLRQQRTFIKSLLHAGVIEDLEHDQLQGYVAGIAVLKIARGQRCCCRVVWV